MHGGHSSPSPLRHRLNPTVVNQAKRLGEVKTLSLRLDKTTQRETISKSAWKKQESEKDSAFLRTFWKTAPQWKAERHPIIPLQRSEGSQIDSHFLNKEKSLKITFDEKGTQLGYGRDLKETFQLRFAPSEFRFCKNKLLQNCTVGFALRHLRK